MNPAPGSTSADLKETLADLRRQLDEAARQLDERTAERDEALEQQTATAEVLQVINSSPGELQPVFDAMLERAVRLCEAAHGYLYTYEDERFVPVATHGDAAHAEWLRRRGPVVGLGTSPHGRISRGERFVHIADVREYDAYRDQVGRFRESCDHAGTRTFLAVALRKDDALLGVIHVYRREVRPFTDKQIALLQNFAAQAVIAMENARLLTQTREALEQQTATSDILRVIAAAPGDAEGTLRKIAETTSHLFGAVGASFRLAEGDEYTLGISVGHGAEEVYRALYDAPDRPRPLVSARGLPGTVIRENRQIHLADLDNLAPEFAAWPGPPILRAAGIRTAVGTPLRRGDRAIGALLVYRNQLRPFDANEMDLLQSFADQAVIAIEDARLLTETREALEQQTATADVLKVINSSPGDLPPVFDAILEKAHHLCGAADGALFLRDGERFRPAAIHVPAAYAEQLRRGYVASEVPVSARLLAGEDFVHIPDIALVDHPTMRAGLELSGTRTLLAVPLRKGDDLLGMIVGARKEVRPFTDKQIALLQNFAAQAVIAMENARLLTETREALEQQTATAEVLQVINSSPGDLQPVFEAILEKAHSLCDVASGTLQLYDGDQKFHAEAVRGLPEELADFLRQGYHAGPNLPQPRLIAGEARAHATDLAGVDDPGARTAVELGNIRSICCVPLRRDSALLGFISAARFEVRPFSEKEIAILEGFAAQAVIAMENARLLGELRQRTEEVAELNRGLEARVAQQVEELGRVGRLKRFLAPQLAELIVSQGDEKILESHRREIVVVFCDLRGYTAFTETAEPEEVLDFLREYHGALGPLVSQFEGTLDQFSGDGIMVFFNDPVPIPDPAERAVKMAVAMREAAGSLIATWRERGRELGFGAGIAQGYATLGQIGFSERSGYTAIGTVCNVAARLCAEAKDGQILLAQRVNVALKGSIATEQVGALALKGLTQPVVAYNVPLAGSQTALRVIEGGAPNA
jgi:GAF domain-containing protein